jgi:uncharacterized protein
VKSTVYFKKIDKTTDISQTTKQLLSIFIQKENIKLETEIPLKVHFGESGNKTFIKPQNYDGIIDYLEENNIKTSFIETNVMYGGKRHRKDLHIKLAKEHGFTRLPIIIADGECGESYYKINNCMYGKEFEKYNQIIVLSHFKGHILAGFGGAIKQLSMGFASKGGKMAMHFGIKPQIKKYKCKKCHLCEKRCNEKAIHITNKPYIDHTKCVGCGACVSICPNKSISIFSIKSILHIFGFHNPFKKKLVEYAYNSSKNKNHIYINYLINITKGCDCEPRKMTPMMDDIGILISSDPVAIDKASYDLIAKQGIKLRGKDHFIHAKKLNFGNSKYLLINL